MYSFSFTSSIIVISGPMGAGKSTIAGLLAERLDRAVIINGWQVQKMIASGMSSPRSQADADVHPEFAVQLQVRLRAACAIAKSFVSAGYVAILEEQVVGERVEHLLQELHDLPFYFVMLAPPFDVVAARERGRGTDNFARWGSWDELLATGTRRIGLWLDNSNDSPEETLRAIMHRAPTEAQVRAQGRRMPGTVHLIHGYLCTGKTTFATQLSDRIAGVRISLDEWMTTLSADQVRVDDELLERVHVLANAHWPAVVERGIDVVLDFGFWTRRRRDEVRSIARRSGAVTRLWWTRCPDAVALHRCLERNSQRHQGYYIDVAGFQALRAKYEPLEDDEPHQVVTTDEG